MADFSKLLDRGKRRQEIKSVKGKWCNCESCGKRKVSFPYTDKKKYVWQLCEACIEGLITVEGNDP